MNYIDLKYVNLLSVRLDRFTVKSTSPYKVNFRCPICGDSQVSKTKARGWILERNNDAMFHCFNCNTSLGFRNFLRSVDINLYNDYIIDTKLDQGIKKKEVQSPLDAITHKVPKFKKSNSPLTKIKKVSQLKPDHSVKKYVESRQIPPSKHYKLYYAPKFNAWVNSIIPNKLSTKHDEPRLVLPFIDKGGNLFGFTGRSFSKDGLRYITIMLDESKPKIFGLDKIDFNKRYYITEGQIDSLFLENAVATGDASGNNYGLDNLKNAVYVFDNEPRNKDVIRQMERVVHAGHKIVVWPEKIEQKDINDMVLAGLKMVDIQEIIDNNIHSGLGASLAITSWRKV